MQEAFQQANREILRVAGEAPALLGMGTTLTVLRLDSETGWFEVGHVGDSRAYRLNRDALSQVTRDHTVVAGMVEAGMLSSAEAQGHYLGHVLSRVLGAEEALEAELTLGMAEAGDRFLVCSDGLMRVMNEEDLKEWLQKSRELEVEDVVRALVEEANRRGGPDNVTVGILAVDAIL
jgi:protein phosphatase